MDSFAAFTKMTGVMDLNLTDSAARLLHPPNRGGTSKLRSEIFVPCHLCEGCKRSPQCKINCINKISAEVGLLAVSLIGHGFTLQTLNGADHLGGFISMASEYFPLTPLRL